MSDLNWSLKTHWFKAFSDANKPFAKGFESLCVLLLFRWNGGTRSPVADRNLPQWEERGYVQSAGCGQHGWSLLHAGHGHGALPHHLCLWASLLLEAQILLHWGLHWQARSPFLHQSGKEQFVYKRCTFACAGMFSKPSLACLVVWKNKNVLWLYTELQIKNQSKTTSTHRKKAIESMNM